LKIILTATAVILIFVSSIFAQTELTGMGKIFPKDESSKDLSFTEFYIQLKNAVENNHMNFILDIVSPEIQLNQNEPDQNNIEGFKKKYDLKDSANEFWISAGKLLKLGAYYAPNQDSSAFMMPALYYFDEYNKLFGEEYYFKFENSDNLGNAVTDNVKVYKESNESSEILGTLNYEVVKVKNFDYDKFVPWFKIELKDGSIGYVKNEDLYLSIFDYYMVLKKVNGEWSLVAFEKTGV